MDHPTAGSCRVCFRSGTIGVLGIVALALPLALTGCPSDRSSTRAKGDEHAEDDGRGKGKPAPDEAAALAKDDAKAKPAAEPQAEPEGKPNPFRKGQVAPKGLTEDELKLYAAAQGDPLEGEFTLEQALEGDETLADKSAGKLTATFKTTMGSFECTLFEDKTPGTVANFVGLARGVRPAWDLKKNEWTKTPYYDGVLFHRVIDGFMIQTGDPTGSGNGHPGYVIADEIDNSLKHNKAGILSMANRGPNTGGAQFFVTVRDTAHLDGKHAVFGQCEPKVPVAISKVRTDPRFANRPVEPVRIESVVISRKK